VSQERTKVPIRYEDGSNKKAGVIILLSFNILMLLCQYGFKLRIIPAPKQTERNIYKKAINISPVNFIILYK